jgi:hypothetical protein
VTAQALGASSDLVIYIISYTPSFHIISLGVGTNAQATAALAPGRYHIMVEDWGNNQTVPSYSLRLSGGVSASVVPSQPLTADEVRAATGYDPPMPW